METKRICYRRKNNIQSFLSYLWGMETVVVQDSLSILDFVFLSYLWGMETSTLPFISNFFKQVLILPMRNGNRISWDSEGLRSKFLSYLWGMETKKTWRNWQESARRFLSYLWGMETIRAGWWGNKRILFLSYLWGMETATFCISSSCKTQFLSYLWGMETISIWHCGSLRFF